MTLTTERTKRCPVCSDEKPLTEFYSGKGACKICADMRRKQLRALKATSVQVPVVGGRSCRVCGRDMERREYETAEDYKLRVFCGIGCAKVYIDRYRAEMEAKADREREERLVSLRKAQLEESSSEEVYPWERQKVRPAIVTHTCPLCMRRRIPGVACRCGYSF